MLKITDKKDCCGCTACASVCKHGSITLKPDNEGFFYPYVDESKCIDCGLCEIVCPIIKYRKIPKKANPQIYGAVNKNYKQYMNSASGGIYILLAEYIISIGGVVCGAAYGKDWDVYHDFAENIVDCSLFQSSKYTQSDIRGIYLKIKTLLKNGRTVLFTGTPCQVAGLKGFLRKDYDNLLCIDLICHGVPSPRLYRDYLDFISQGKKISRINFKHKSVNKPKTYLRVDFFDGTNMQECLKTNVWDRLYFGHCAIRPSCHDCQFAHFNRVGDITIGDFWGIRKYYPNFHPKDCPSLVFVNNIKGQTLFDIICSNLDIIHCTQNEVLQPQLHEPTKQSPHRKLFWKQYELYGFSKIVKEYGGYTIKNRVKDYIKRFYENRHSYIS